MWAPSLPWLDPVPNTRSGWASPWLSALDLGPCQGVVLPSRRCQMGTKTSKRTLSYTFPPAPSLRTRVGRARPGPSAVVWG